MTESDLARPLMLNSVGGLVQVVDDAGDAVDAGSRIERLCQSFRYCMGLDELRTTAWQDSPMHNTQPCADVRPTRTSAKSKQDHSTTEMSPPPQKKQKRK